ncbi:MAG: 1-acyl-sn-glycerol-3-phosphate acyltransferase [Alphaproteobacteria bacterium]|nr:MAG: 1-acyl-sn-glycerol-3-phosphate acyltransferase [Alphaproteobacteria bacterium]
MLRAIPVLAAAAAITLALIPVQWISVALKLRSRRSIPVLYHRMLCALIGIRIREVGERVREHPLLVVANHCSWLDVPVITAAAPVVFVAKREVAGWPVFGLLARLQRSVFVDRERRHKTGEVNAQIAQRLAEGDPVVLFGEGTSSDGNRVLPFRSALIGAARDALAEAAYTRLHGLPIGRLHRPLVAWYGGMDLMPHLIRVLGQGAFDVVLTWGEPVAYEAQTDRKAVAKSLECTVRRLTTAALRHRPADRSAAGHSFLPGKPVREAPDREQGMTEALELVEMHREPERPGSASTQAA